MAVSYDATSNATIATQQVSPDPVYRGDCRNIRCGYIREFLDAEVGPDGHFWGAFVDACLNETEAKYAGPGDCNVDAGNYGQGNGHLAKIGRATTQLYVAEGEISGGG